jgi:hypothetical protein
MKRIWLKYNIFILLQFYIYFIFIYSLLYLFIHCYIYILIKIFIIKISSQLIIFIIIYNFIYFIISCIILFILSTYYITHLFIIISFKSLSTISYHLFHILSYLYLYFSFNMYTSNIQNNEQPIDIEKLTFKINSFHL